MSWITNTILHLGLGDEDKVDAINSFFGEQDGFVCVDDPKLPRGWYGGAKMLETNIYIGAFNHIDILGLISHIRSVVFQEPHAVQLILMDQEQDWFRLVDLFPLDQQRYEQDKKAEIAEQRHAADA